ncbi:hypothetical protein RND71_025644 [Anisodus tanguticus]|uniref:Uncharacterized protein n=1 Tax=Anisodus tanguticus TaxID=243964 RepID=A0AAE1RTG1_9SOLA|nr:hypothetical protein RND71_025644 [Anisodus tanguticus]
MAWLSRSGDGESELRRWLVAIVVPSSINLASYDKHFFSGVDWSQVLPPTTTKIKFLIVFKCKSEIIEPLSLMSKDGESQEYDDEEINYDDLKRRMRIHRIK